MRHACARQPCLLEAAAVGCAGEVPLLWGSPSACFGPQPHRLHASAAPPLPARSWPTLRSACGRRRRRRRGWRRRSRRAVLRCTVLYCAAHVLRCAVLGGAGEVWVMGATPLQHLQPQEFVITGMVVGFHSGPFLSLISSQAPAPTGAPRPAAVVARQRGPAQGGGRQGAAAAGAAGAGDEGAGGWWGAAPLLAVGGPAQQPMRLASIAHSLPHISQPAHPPHPAPPLPHGSARRWRRDSRTSGTSRRLCSRARSTWRSSRWAGGGGPGKPPATWGGSAAAQHGCGHGLSFARRSAHLPDCLWQH